MKIKVDERFRMLLWWLVLLVAVALGFGVTNSLKRNIEKASFSDISIAARSKRTDIEKDLNNAVSYLSLLGKDETEDGFFKGDDKKFAFVREQLRALAVGVYDSEKDEVKASLSGTLSYSGNFENLKIIMKDACKKGRVVVVRENSFLESGDLGVFVPIMNDSNEVIGLSFGFYNLENFIMKISESIYNGAGYCMLTDSEGNVIVPSDKFNIYMGSEDAHNDLGKSEIEKIFDNLDDNKFRKIERGGNKYYVYALGLEDYSDYVLVAVIDGVSIFKNLSLATRGVIAIILIVFAVTIVQSIYFLTTLKKRKNEFDDVLNFDELTGLPTKPHHKNIALSILKRAKGNYAYAACDVSEFKYFNSTFGYDYGNLVLKYIANVMSDALLKDETVSRTSGDHFAMLLHYNDPEELTSRLMRILDTASVLPVTDDGRQPRAVFTCGVYLVGNESDINRIRARANVARKGLKKSITNQIAFYNEADFNNELEIHELQEDLLHAVDNKELVVFLQPKYGITNEEVIGAEALVRWNHRSKGLLSPSVFIPLAEKIGLVKEIDFYVFAAVCKQLNQWKAEGKMIVPISVNFSRVHLGDDDFVAKLIRVTKENDIEPQYLEIELTESAVYDEMEHLLDIMYLIKEAGFGLSMDDFGSGYSSLHLLREMPVDVLKLDKGFLDDCSDENQRERKVISHVISLAKDLQISVLAEGVETESQKNFLQEANCDMIQGYYYAKPMPMKDFAKYIEESGVK